MTHNPHEVSIESVFGGPEVIADQEIRDHLSQKGIDPHQAPYFAAQEIATHWNLPMVEASQMVSQL